MPSAAGGGSPQRPAKPSKGPTIRLKDGKAVGLFVESTAGTPLAKVASEVITVRDLGEAIAVAHGGHDPDAKGGSKGVAEILDRLIDGRLVVLEARAMGIEELPEFKQNLATFTDSALRDLLKRKAATRAKVDRAQLDRAYKDATRHWKIRSVLFKEEAEAKRFAERLAGGASFDDLASQVVREKKAQGGAGVETVPESKMLPQVVDVVRALPVGAASPVVAVPGGFALLRSEGAVQQDDPETRQRLEAQLRNEAQLEAVRAYAATIVKKHARTDAKLLGALDFDGDEARLESLGKDTRVLVRIAGEAPITVADLTKAIDKKFFHGAKRAAQKQRINPQKQAVLDEMVAKRALVTEARLRRIHETEEFKYMVREYRNSLAFGAAVERVVVPGVKVEEQEVKAYYDRGGAEFMYPAFYRLDGIAFASAAEAEGSLRKLRSGTDFAWLRANATGQLDASKQPLRFSSEMPLDASALPAGLAKALTGSKSGDYRTYSDEGAHYVIRAVEVTPPQRRPLDEVRGAIEQKVRGEKMSAALADWTRKLRQHYPVQVLVSSIQ
jgi:hypothetical protein